MSSRAMDLFAARRVGEHGHVLAQLGSSFGRCRAVRAIGLLLQAAFPRVAKSGQRLIEAVRPRASRRRARGQRAVSSA